jgi:uncharacterized protein
MKHLASKHRKLIDMLQKLDSLIVAFSGGVDSALLLKASYSVLDKRVLAVTADSSSVPRREIQEARRIANQIGARHVILETQEIDDVNYTSNPVNRCYFCKSELYSKLFEIAARERISTIANGTNLDDLGDYRPGLQAANEYHVISPLKEAQLTKQDVRDLAKQLDLEIWDKPASPCLASRIPYGSRVSPRKLAIIEEAELFLRNINVRDLRVRHFGKKARIETHKDDFQVISHNMPAIVQKFNLLGFEEVEVAEFRSGALNSRLNL